MERAGWAVLCRNWKGGGGELDVVAVRNGSLRFIEVKTRSSADPVGIEAVDARKRMRLARAANAWLQQSEVVYHELAFTVVLVEPDGMTWYDDAFDVDSLCP